MTIKPAAGQTADVGAPITVPVLPTALAAQAPLGLGPPKLSVCTVYETVYETPTAIVTSYNKRVNYDNPLQGPGAILAWLGIIAGSIGNTAFIFLGVDTIDAVAIQCIGGRGFGRYCIYHGPIITENRWAGVKNAFGPDKEILIPEQTEMEARVPRPLTRAITTNCCNAPTDDSRHALHPLLKYTMV
jgi:hypothetical protein